MTPPQPINDALADTGRILADRGATIEVEGREVLEDETLSPGVRRQVLRIVNELLANVAKYTSDMGTASVHLEFCGEDLICLVTNTMSADQGGAEKTVRGGTVSSGLGLRGVRRRVETLGGKIAITSSGNRWTVTFDVPVRATSG